MKRPIESDYVSLVGYTRALEEYCDALTQPEPAIIGTYLEKDKEQEPVAIIHRNEYNEYRLEPHDNFDIKSIPFNIDVPLFKSPQRKPLTDEQRKEISKGWQGRNWTCGDIIDAVEAAHGIKEMNNG